MNIVIPSYEKHYVYNKNFLESFEKFCLDKQDVNIYFIIDDYNVNMFNELKNISSSVNIIDFSKLIKIVDNNVTDISFSTKYSRQSIKKFFAGFYFKDDYIVLDSENLCLKMFYMKDIFNKIIEKPILYTTNITQNIQLDVVKNCNELLKMNTNKWFFLKSYWYYNFNILNKLMDFLKNYNTSVFELLKNKIFFEYQLYCQFIDKEKLNNVLNIDNLLTNDILNDLNNSFLGKTNYEFICTILNDNNIEFYKNLLMSNDERIIRLHWMNDTYKKYLIENTNISIGTFHWD